MSSIYLSNETTFSALLEEIFMPPASLTRSEREEEEARCNGGCGPGTCFAA